MPYSIIIEWATSTFALFHHDVLSNSHTALEKCVLFLHYCLCTLNGCRLIILFFLHVFPLCLLWYFRLSFRCLLHIIHRLNAFTVALISFRWLSFLSWTFLFYFFHSRDWTSVNQIFLVFLIHALSILCNVSQNIMIFLLLSAISR